MSSLLSGFTKNINGVQNSVDSSTKAASSISDTVSASAVSIKSLVQATTNNIRIAFVVCIVIFVSFFTILLVLFLVHEYNKWFGKQAPVKKTHAKHKLKR